MLLLVITLGCGVAIGWLRGGRLSRLATVPIAGLSLLLAAVVIQLLSGAAADVGRWLTVLASAAAALLALAFLGRNRRLPGAGLLAAGLAANALVVLINGAMPVSVQAAHRAGVPLRTIAQSAGHQLGTHGSTLVPLADVIPLPLPGGEQVLSAGDVLVLAGLGSLVASTMAATAGFTAAAGGGHRRPRRFASRREGRPRVAPERGAPEWGSPEQGSPERVAQPRPDVWDHVGYGQEEAQASVPRQERSQPRQAPEHLSNGPRPSAAGLSAAEPPATAFPNSGPTAIPGISSRRGTPPG